jgi:glucose/mannose-6-phosphate isomerase
MLESNFEYDRNQLRENITADVLAKNKIPFERIKFLQAQDSLTEILLHVMLGDFVSYYLAMLNRVNPGVNDVIDYFKERLS